MLGCTVSTRHHSPPTVACMSSPCERVKTAPHASPTVDRHKSHLHAVRCALVHASPPAHSPPTHRGLDPPLTAYPLPGARATCIAALVLLLCTSPAPHSPPTDYHRQPTPSPTSLLPPTTSPHPVKVQPPTLHLPPTPRQTLMGNIRPRTGSEGSDGNHPTGMSAGVGSVPFGATRFATAPHCAYSLLACAPRCAYSLPPPIIRYRPPSLPPPIVLIR